MNTPPSAARVDVQLNDALWDAIAPRGTRESTFAEQHQRVCAVVAEALREHLAGEADEHRQAHEDETENTAREIDRAQAALASFRAETLRAAADEVEAMQTGYDLEADGVRRAIAERLRRKAQDGPR